MERDADTNESDSLRDVARWLTTPATCGVYLSALDLERIGASAGIHGLPQNRRFAVEQLFRAAALEESLDQLFDSLIGEIEQHRRAYRDCESSSLDRWAEIAGATIATLREMRAASSVVD